MTTNREITEVLADFAWLVNATDVEITATYSFGEPDFDPTAARENAANKPVLTYMKLTGLDRAAAVAEMHGRI